jgi:hypothetical protein
MKIKLAHKYDDVKDNYPAGNFNVRFKRIENKDQYQKQGIHHNGSISEDHQDILQPGQWDHLPAAVVAPVTHFHIPEYNRQNKTQVAEDGYFGEEAHGKDLKV